MGSAASAQLLPPTVSEAQARDFSGDRWDQAKWNEQKDAGSNSVSKEQFLQVRGLVLLGGANVGSFRKASETMKRPFQLKC